VGKPALVIGGHDKHSESLKNYWWLVDI